MLVFRRQPAEVTINILWVDPQCISNRLSLRYPRDVACASSRKPTSVCHELDVVYSSLRYGKVHFNGIAAHARYAGTAPRVFYLADILRM